MGGQESEHWEQTWFFTYRARMETQQSVMETLFLQPILSLRFSCIDAGPGSSPEKLCIASIALPIATVCIFHFHGAAAAY